jgi:magnesium transporter
VETVQTRLPWLFLNLLTATMGASVVYYFSETLENVIVLAAIMPVVAGLGGNAGTQALAVTVRRLALESGLGSSRFSAVFKELLVGIVNGAVLGGVVATVAAVIGGDPKLGLVVFLAMCGNQAAAGFAGSLFPTILDRAGIDPAVASSVFVTALTDLLGFLFLLGLATALLL